MTSNRQDKDKEIDIEKFNSNILYFEKIICCSGSSYNISTSKYKIGATFIGIKTNISGEYKLHTHVVLLPFIKNEEIVPYPFFNPNLYLKDICFNVDESFYFWLYEEMKRQNSIVIMSFENNILRVIEGYGNLLINIDKKCDEEKEWMKQ